MKLLFKKFLKGIFIKLKCNISPSYYGDGSLVDSMKNNNWSFEIEFSDEITKVKKIVTLEELVEFKNDIDKSIEAYQRMKNLVLS